MFNLFKKKELFTAVVSGIITPLEKVKDPVFSQKMMGDGFAIVPTDKIIYAPMSGTITVCFPTKHAVGMKLNNGVEVLIHIGIDTVNLAGEGFKLFVEQGQVIKQGTPLVEIDIDLIKSRGYDSTVMILFPNKDIKLGELSKNIEANQSIAVEF